MPKSFYAAVFLFALLALLLLGSLMRANAEPSVQYLMADQYGRITPEGYAAGLSDIAAAEAAAESTRQAAELSAETAAIASNIVDEVVKALTGAIGFGYVSGHTVSFAGSVNISTGAAARIVYCQFGAAGTAFTNGTLHSGHYVWHVYTETLNAMPAIKYKIELNATNAWEDVEYQTTQQYSDTTVNGVNYSTVYRSTVWMPSSLDGAFFLAFCETYGGGQAGGLFDVIDGFTIGGKRGFSGVRVRDGLAWTYECGALMSVTNEASQ